MQEYKITYFSDKASKTTLPMTDLEFYRGIRDGRWREQVERVRAQLQLAQSKRERDSIKGKLPVAALSGVFDGGHAGTNLVEPSGLLQLDFDMGDNEHLSNFADLKAIIGQVKYIRFCSLSCSGNGFWATMPITSPERYGEQAQAAMIYFRRFGLEADVKCKDITRLRFVTYDAAPYFNDAAVPFPFIPERHEAPKQHQSKPTIKATLLPHVTQSSEDMYADTCRYLEAIGARDLSADGDTWRKIGYGFAHSFGESGRRLFHAFSCNYPGYSFEECERRYTDFLRSKGGGMPATALSFFQLCHENGITLPRQRPPW